MQEPQLRNCPVRETCLYADLGIVDVPAAEAAMTHARGLRLKGVTPDLLLFLAHPPTVALGLRDSSASHPKDLLVSPSKLAEEGIALTRSVRGGGITYHWPGQIVCYPVLKLRASELDIPGYMKNLEQVAVETLGRFGVDATRRRGQAAYIGLWHNGSKIVSMGVRVSSGVTSFGFAINVQGDHAASKYVRPCGLEGVELITMEEILGTAPPREAVMEAVVEIFGTVFCRATATMSDRLFRESALLGPFPAIEK